MSLYVLKAQVYVAEGYPLLGAVRFLRMSRKTIEPQEHDRWIRHKDVSGVLEYASVSIIKNSHLPGIIRVIINAYGETKI